MSEAAGYKATLSTPSDLEMVMVREFDAPRELVFKAYTDPEQMPHWWGLRNTTTIVDRMDVRPGGAWRYVERGEDGREHGFHGEYREIVPPERLVYTFEYEGMPGHVAVDTVTLEEHGGKTKVTIHALFASKEDRDGMLASGAEWGANESWDQLDELLARLQG
jgi:uncharacterized protein YndB with AHSA1/START domain